MSDISNPYQSPAAGTEIVKPLVAQGTLTEIMLKHLVDASPWMRFLGIMGFIGSGFLALIGIGSLVTAPLAATSLDIDIFDEVAPYLSYFVQGFGSLLFIYALYFIGAGALMFFPAYFTYQFGAKVRAFVQTNSEQELELAFRNNRSLWKFRGILMIIGLAFIPLLIIIVIVVIVAVLAIC